MVRLYRYGQQFPYLGDAIALWKRTDGDVLQLSALADRAASVQAATRPDPRALQALRDELHVLDGRMRRDASQFLGYLTRCARLLHDVMVVCSLVTLLLVLITCVLAMRRIRDYLLSHEGRFRTAFQQAALGMVKFDLRGNVLDANASMANILLYRPEELQACTLAEVMHPEDIKLDSRGMLDWPKLLQSGEKRFVRADGGVMGPLERIAGGAGAGRADPGAGGDRRCVACARPGRPSGLPCVPRCADGADQSA